MRKNKDLVKQITALVLIIILSFVVIKIVVSKKFISKSDSLKNSLRDADKKEKFLQERNKAIPDISDIKRRYEKARADLDLLKNNLLKQSQTQKSVRGKKAFVNIHSPVEVQRHIGKIMAIAGKNDIDIKKFSNLQADSRPLLSFEISSRFSNLSSFIDELDAMKQRVVISKLDIVKSPEASQLLVNLEINL